MTAWRKVLTIAGSDSSGGAGIQADIKTISANEAYAASVITSITAQNTLGVQAVESVSLSMVDQQLKSVCSDIKFDAVKIGLLPNDECIELVAQWCKKMAWLRVVIDPVMVAQSGDRLCCGNTQLALLKHLLPKAELVTPNIPEAEVLLKTEICSIKQQELAAVQLSNDLSVAVLLKGGHGDKKQCIDVLADRCHIHHFESDRIVTKNTHGTGCSLSSAVACQLAHGLALPDAVEKAHAYCRQAIRAAVDQRLGQGAGPIAHFYDWWQR